MERFSSKRPCSLWFANHSPSKLVQVQCSYNSLAFKKANRAVPHLGYRRGADLPYSSYWWTTESVTHGQCDASYLPSRGASPPFWPVPNYSAWWSEARVCEQLAQGCYLTVNRAGVEFATSEWPVRHVTVTPCTKPHFSITVFQKYWSIKFWTFFAPTVFDFSRKGAPQKINRKRCQLSPGHKE